jgi:RHS repeat-associated protein
MTKGGSTYYLTYDQVGSVRVVADASGNVVKRIDYDSFGNIIEDTDPAFDVPFGFAGGLHDRDTGLVRFGYRDYDPDVGRWTAKDPILFAGGDTDLYGYCLSDPVNLIDPEGLLWGSVFSRGAGKGILSGGPGALTGGIIGAFGGATLGTMTGIPGMGFVGGIVGGYVGGKIGGYFDPEAAGQLNYGEDDILKDMERQDNPCK